MLRPEQIRLSAAEPGDGHRARVCEVTFYGHDASVRLELCGVHGAIGLTALVPGHASPKPGEIVGVSVEGEAMAYQRQPGRAPALAQTRSR
jgi:iron(III) transport system ATP-binding protein